VPVKKGQNLAKNKVFSIGTEIELTEDRKQLELENKT
jgi:hypothetical protein